MASLRHAGGQSKIEQLWRQVMDTFKWATGGMVNFEEENFAVMKRQVDALTAEDISLEESLSEMRRHPGFRSEEAVGNIHICDSDIATMQVFVLHKNQQMPIHDHPQMIGILKVIKGCVRINSYTLKGYERKVAGGSILQTSKVTVEVCKGDPACILTPSERNFHSIIAVNGEAAFLDILSPPYFTRRPGQELNVCNYYREGGLAGGADAENLVRLEEIPPPEDYWTVKGEYKGPKIDQQFGITHHLRPSLVPPK
ncbi:2-aminoethanethiol dioxygenase [Frankliniella fusca]|uniref:2-aminoethanethiol dioxygenase n=1 Tax=Frankliniella fusca TaxID=407009 RepID=A0AAE1HHE5_9NEOP|nr:2-aminoethanethiol dioxygenase [Frankliniella fusca]